MGSGKALWAKVVNEAGISMDEQAQNEVRLGFPRAAKSSYKGGA